MSAVRSYRDLEVWKKAVSWTELVYRASSLWPTDERFGLTSQVRRSSVSIASNIAEGAARHGTADFRRFIGIAQGSLAEAETQLLIAYRLDYLSEDQLNRLTAGADEISRMLMSLSAALKRRAE
ncbi:MAG: four helix bundle protein [Brevundimonas sp.]|jgi:four helix bundle protein|nr:four helix bundle protein [Brevundimonas sp.]